MFDWMLPENHAIAILKKDHEAVKALFDGFAKAETAAAKQRIIEEAVSALKIHAIIEEEIFYPKVRSHVGSKLMNEADEEHHVAKLLIAELDCSRGAKDHRDAKFTVLAENVRHHIKEEEHELLPKAKEMNVDFEAVGIEMLDRKAELVENGIPSDAEHAMVAKVNGKADSPAVAARKHTARKAHKPRQTRTRKVSAPARGERKRAAHAAR